MIASIILNDMNRTREASYGYRSWMLQDIQEPYEVILNLYNDQKPQFESLGAGGNPYCSRGTNVFAPNAFFNSSAANNIGLHFASGKYVFFTNSDIIYPSNYLRIVSKEISKRDVCFSLGSRINLNSDQTSSLSAPSQYTIKNNFDFMIGYENLPGRVMIHGMSPWMILRSIAENIGGFNPKVLCNEDSEFDDRAMHYLRRTDQQLCLYAITDIYGYHLHHEPSELYHASILAKSIVEPQRLQLTANPNGTEDIIPTNLRSLGSLLNDFHGTVPPNEEMHPTAKQLLKKRMRKIELIRRIYSSYRVLRGCE
jgi:hypothetical protein